MKMKSLLLYFILVVLNLSAQNEPFINNICLPSKQYLLSGVQNDLFFQTFLKRWRPFDDFVRLSGTAEYSRRYEKVASVKNPETGKVIRVELVNGDRFEVVKALECTVLAGEAGTGKVLVGEVSMVNDDSNDNCFHEPIGRFPVIEEDEQPIHLLASDYSKFL